MNKKRFIKLQTAHLYPQWTWPLTFLWISELPHKPLALGTTLSYPMKRCNRASFTASAHFHMSSFKTDRIKWEKGTCCVWMLSLWIWPYCTPTLEVCVIRNNACATCKTCPEIWVLSYGFILQLTSVSSHWMYKAKRNGSSLWALNIQWQTLRRTRAAKDFQAMKHSSPEVIESFCTKRKRHVLLWLKQ